LGFWAQLNYSKREAELRDFALLDRPASRPKIAYQGRKSGAKGMFERPAMDKIVGYRGDHTAWCIDCAKERYGVYGTSLTNTKDRDGQYLEEIGAADRGDPSGEFCSQCGKTILAPRR
jgi:hypothetical protein